MNLAMRSTKKAITTGNKLEHSRASSNMISSLTYNCAKQKKTVKQFPIQPMRYDISKH